MGTLAGHGITFDCCQVSDYDAILSMYPPVLTNVALYYYLLSREWPNKKCIVRNTLAAYKTSSFLPIPRLFYAFIVRVHLNKYINKLVDNCE